MRRMPIPVRPKPFLQEGCPPRIYAGLARLSPGCPPDRGRLHTCYSPVRRSPPPGIATRRAAPRLACVKPAASVHPEPGSNSPLLLSYLFRLFSQFVCPAVLSFTRIDGKSFVLPCCCASFADIYISQTTCPVASFHCPRRCRCPGAFTLRLFATAVAKLLQSGLASKYFPKIIAYLPSLCMQSFNFQLNQKMLNFISFC